jgi:hypothetical protein
LVVLKKFYFCKLPMLKCSEDTGISNIALLGYFEGPVLTWKVNIPYSGLYWEVF